MSELSYETWQTRTENNEAKKILNRLDCAKFERERQMAQLQDYLSPKQSLLSDPIRKLPPEILLEIFMYILDRHPVSLCYSPTKGHLKLKSPIFGLTWVSAWWRSLILSEGRMWSGFHMNYLRIPEIEPELIELMGECFRVRTGKSAPVQFTVAGLNHLAPSCYEPILDIVIQSAQRWKDAAIHFGDRSLAVEYFTKSLLEAGTFEYPLLESLSLRYDFRDGGSGGFSSFRNCSRLRKLQATHLYYPDLDLVDTANLTTLELVEYSGPSLNHLLVKCPLLETLIIARFKYTPGHTSIPDSDSTVALLDAAVNNTDYDLSRLSHLDIIIRDLGWTPNVIWSGLHLPALTHLSFQYWMESGEAIRELIELLTRSKCVLQRITVDLPKFEQGRWVEFLDGIAPVMAPDICVVEKW